MGGRSAFVDRHAHFLDAELFTSPIFQRRGPGFEALVGDYSALPRRYLPEDYLNDAGDSHRRMLRFLVEPCAAARK